MIDYSKWIEKPYSVTSLQLDTRNPRLPESDDERSQRDLIAELVEHEKVHDLAKSIVDKGFYPVEALIVVEEASKKVVVEGNRRLTALKLLINPDLAPVTDQKKFRLLSERAPLTQLNKVKVLIAPSRSAAAPIIMGKHTRPQIEGWKPNMRAKFCKQLIDSGMTVHDIADEYAIAPSEISDLLQSHEMYSLACHLDLPEEIAKLVRNPREFPVTNLDRIYRNSEVAKFLGIHFDSDKQLIGSINPDEFKKGFSKIVTDVATGDVDSRSLNSTTEIKEYLNSFGSAKPNTKTKGVFNSETILRGTPPPKQKTPSRKKVAKKKVAKKSTSIIPSSIRCELDSKRICDIFDELKKLRVEQYPNSVSMMLRTLVEMSLANYLEKSGKLSALTKQQQKSKGKGKNWHPTLKQMMNYVIQEDADMKLNPNAMKSLSKLTSDRESMFSVDALDYFVHNQFYHPTEAQLRGFWEALEPVLRITLVEPDPQGK